MGTTAKSGKLVHATVTFDDRLDQDTWRKMAREGEHAPAADPEVAPQVPEPRLYNPSGPFYDLTRSEPEPAPKPAPEPEQEQRESRRRRSEDEDADQPRRRGRSRDTTEE